jgi:hypothetical protein
MERVKATPEDEPQGNWIQSGDWVQTQLRINLQLLAAQAQEQIDHFPPYVAIIEEMIGDYLHHSVSIHTYWTISQEQTHRLNALREYLLAHNTPQSGDFWEEAALFSDPRWNEVRALAKVALTSLQWPIETPPPESGHV